MKNLCNTIVLFSLFTSSTAFAQGEADSTGLPGDHFSLQGALELFSKAASVEAFEEAINKESNHVNNLDLDQDGEIDYVRVEDTMENDVHAIVLQVAVKENEIQDVAVIELEKNGEESALLQIIGDEELYGPEVMVEPTDEKATGGKSGPSPAMETTYVVVNVWGWPCVRHVYAPGYRPWISPYRWAEHPKWWRPWRPIAWRAHHSHCQHYHARFHVVHVHRVTRAHAFYSPHRHTSSHVHVHYKSAHENHKAHSKRHHDNKQGVDGDKTGNGSAKNKVAIGKGEKGVKGNGKEKMNNNTGTNPKQKAGTPAKGDGKGKIKSGGGKRGGGK
ncbi:MAG: hypothetical protein SH856_10770 [Flavobacteriales bacterium]|nr:hypothetical protein [Flavobacteriales bacterium]